MAGLRIVRVEGGARERGRQAGAALGEQIHAALAFHRRRLDGRGLRRTELERLLLPFLEEARRVLPGPLEQIEGMAEGAEADVFELLAVNALEELEPLLETRLPGRCSTFTACRPGATLLAHNEQWYGGTSRTSPSSWMSPRPGPRARPRPSPATCQPSA